LGFKEEYDSFIHPIPTDSSYVFWFRISRELLGLDEDVVCGIVYIPPEYTVYSSVDAFSELENEYLALQRNYKYIDILNQNTYELSVGMGYIKLSYSSLKPNTIPPDFLFEKLLRFFIFSIRFIPL
jgi:hypothetical protein